MIISIYTSQATTLPQEEHSSIEAIAGKGLVGDRYSTGKGFYTGVVEWDAHVTLIESEPFLALQASHGIHIEPRDLRRNLITRGIALSTLVGRNFRIGEKAVFHGRKEWPACNHIVKFTGRKEIFEHLAKSSGIGVDVLESGPIRVGDPIVLL